MTGVRASTSNREKTPAAISDARPSSSQPLTARRVLPLNTGSS